MKKLILTLLMLAISHTISAKDFDCNASPNDIWSVYKKGDKNNIGETSGGSGTWQTKNINNLDYDVLKIVWSSTGDWISKKRHNRMKSITDYRTLSSAYDDSLKIQSIINKRCNLDTHKNICPENYIDTNECLSFYTTRYEKVATHFYKHVEAVYKSNTMKNDIINLASKDFGIDKDKIIPTGGLEIADPFSGGGAITNKWHEEQAISRTESKINNLLNMEEPIITRGEFESKADYEKKLQKATSAYKKTLEYNTKNADKLYRESLINSLNSDGLVIIVDRKSIKYDINKEMMTFDINGRISLNRKSEYYRPISVSAKLPPKEAKILKGELLNQERNFVRAYLVYALEEEQLILTGGYLMNYKGMGFDAVKILAKPVKLTINDTNTVFKRGDINSAELNAKIENHLNNKKYQKRLQQIAEHESTCNAFLQSYLLNGKTKTLMAMGTMGCG